MRKVHLSRFQILRMSNIIECPALVKSRLPACRDVSATANSLAACSGRMGEQHLPDPQLVMASQGPGELRSRSSALPP